MAIDALIPPAGEGLVYSSLERLIHLQAQVGTLHLAKKHIRASHMGMHRSVYKGRGMDFSESRPYQTGDDIRTIDWRVTARSGRVHTKVFEEEREKPVLVWLDLRAPMFFATRGQFKSVVAAELASLLLWKTLKEGDRIGGIIQNGTHIELKPSRSRSNALHFLRKISDITKSSSRSTVEEVLGSWTRLRRVSAAGSQVFVVSDFRHISSAAWKQLAMITRHAQLSLIAIHDPFELHPPRHGTVRLTDGRRNLWVNLGQALWRKRYTDRAMLSQLTLQEFSRAYRVPYVSISTADSAQTRLLKLARGMQ